MSAKLSNQDKNNVKIYIIHSNDKNTQNMIKLLKSKGCKGVNGAKAGESVKLGF